MTLLVWGIKQKATKEQAKQRNEHSETQTTVQWWPEWKWGKDEKGKGDEEGKVVKFMATEGNLTFIWVMYYIIIEVYVATDVMLSTNITPINLNFF